MCSSAGDIEDITNCSSEIPKKFNREFVKKCKKCGEKSSILLQKKDAFCKPCFFEYCNHKFRSTIGKSKKIKHGEKVLLACSGGRKSAALLHMTRQTLKSASLKQISISPGILFIDDSFIVSDMNSGIQPDPTCVLNELKRSGYNVIYSSLEMVYKIESEESLYSLVPDNFTSEIFSHNIELKSMMKENFKAVSLDHKDRSLSSKIDLLNHLRLLLITEIAIKAKYNSVFVGDTASSLAVELLTDVALGRGSQIFADTSFHDTRYKIPVYRPLREFLNKEVALYNHLHCTSYKVFSDFLTKTSSNSSIQRLTETFLANLQESFPATVSTVFRTGGKLSKSSINLDKITCIICKSELDNRNSDPCSALEALKISEKLSASSSLQITENDSFSEEFMQFLCHGCCVAFKNMSERQHFSSLIPISSCTKMKRSEMKEELKEFLLEDNTS